MRKTNTCRIDRWQTWRFAGLLWRLRRATAIETGLLQIHRGTVGAGDPTAIDSSVIAIREPISPCLDKDTETEADLNKEIAARFLALNRADSGAFERLNRYETALWRQVGQLLVGLELLRQYPRF